MKHAIQLLKHLLEYVGRGVPIVKRSLECRNLERRRVSVLRMRKLLGFLMVASVACTTACVSRARPVVMPEPKDPEVGDLSCPGPGMSIHELLEQMDRGQPASAPGSDGAVTCAS